MQIVQFRPSTHSFGFDVSESVNIELRAEFAENANVKGIFHKISRSHSKRT